MDYTDLRYFVCVAECLNFTEASHHLYISQSALSRRIADFEQQIGIQLFTRRTRTIDLTPQGQELLEYARKIVFTSDEMQNRAKRITLGFGQRLVMSVPTVYENDTILSLFDPLPPDALKDIDFIFSRIPTGELVSQLESGVADVALSSDVIMNSLSSRDYSLCVVSDLKVKLLALNSHPLAQKEFVTLQDIADEPMIFLVRDEWPGECDWLEKVSSAAGFNLNCIQYAPDYQTIMLYVWLGKALSLLPANGLVRHKEGFVTIPLSGVEFPNLILVWKKENQSSALHRFIDSVRSFLPLSDDALR